MVGRLLRFALTSGTGLLVDLVVYAALNEAGVRAGVANLVSASVGVTFVFVVSARHVFAVRPDWRRDLTAYALWQAALVGSSSVLVDVLTELLDGAYLAGKLLVLPLTFTANFAFMSWLLRGRASRTDAPYPAS